jgi:transcriptional regulator with XRE-family HTH domain
MIIDKQFREQIIAAMKSQGVTRSDLARRLGVTPGFVSNYLNGRKSPGADVMERFSAALNLKPRIVLDPAPESVPA